jgi:Ca2+-binding RTX toxin-like protein
VSTLVTPAGEPRLDGQTIEVTENDQGEIVSSNIYGTSGRDIILGAGEGGSLLYGGDGVSHDMIIGSKGNDLILLGGGIDYVAGSQIPGFVGDEDIYVVSSLIDYAEMETVGMTDVLSIYFAGNAQAMANAIQARVSSLNVDKAYMVGIIEDLAISAVDDAWEAIDRVYFDGFSADRSKPDEFVLYSGETLLTQVFSNETAGESKAYSLLLSRSDFTPQEHYEDTIFFS